MYSYKIYKYMGNTKRIYEMVLFFLLFMVCLVGHKLLKKNFNFLFTLFDNSSYLKNLYKKQKVVLKVLWIIK